MFEVFEQFRISSAFEIIIVAFCIYYLLILLRGTRAMQMVFGILILLGSVFILSQIYPLTTIRWLLDKFSSSFIVILVILFQDDIRRMLSRVGKRGFLASGDLISSKQVLDEITRAANILSQRRIGALIVIERNIILNKYVDIGILLDAKVSMEIILAIFHHHSPIHDGAIIIQQGKIAAAGCFLSLTRKEDVNPNLGTRHRAAIGISEETDAVVVIISEERGSISLVVDGKISKPLTKEDLRKALSNLIHETHFQDTELVRKTPAKNTRSFSNRWNILEKINIFKAGDDDGKTS